MASERQAGILPLSAYTLAVDSRECGQCVQGCIAVNTTVRQAPKHPCTAPSPAPRSGLGTHLLVNSCVEKPARRLQQNALPEIACAVVENLSRFSHKKALVVLPPGLTKRRRQQVLPLLCGRKPAHNLAITLSSLLHARAWATKSA